MFRVAHAQAEGGSASGGSLGVSGSGHGADGGAGGEAQVLRDDRQTLLNILEVVRALNRAERTGENKMSEEDVRFVQKANEQITRYGFFGGLVGGGSTLFILRNANKVFRFTAAIGSWVITSAVGRFAAVDNSLDQIFNGLPAESQLRQAARKVVAMYAEEDGYFAKRYGLNVLEADAETELGLNTWHNDRDKFETQTRPNPSASQSKSSDNMEDGDASEQEIFDMHAYFDNDGSSNSNSASNQSSSMLSKSGADRSAQGANDSWSRETSQQAPQQQQQLQQQRQQYQQSVNDDPFSHGSPYPQLGPNDASSRGGAAALRMYSEDFEDAMIMEQQQQQAQQGHDRTWEDVRKEYYSHHK
ncbi:Hypothetical Protein FCC1311_019942 [Hondaea fermentalgiana]|uniref:Uncharacterized protein n=1 Tax=Hondaea fermentalgiana TaxID=2315210 RepID=A0A2R5G5F7_9STRA|nr:Hypothetical Protein FCC1311_019942 [Hondaea fermentalgiana]|eukprot:GBG25775.1 Hypothetical Protein FCC1311_019942 [Hondaea fermentalgiana]